MNKKDKVPEINENMTFKELFEELDQIEKDKNKKENKDNNEK